MSRRRRQGLSPTLFPFLAVLVCTLGTLILFLALVAQNATEAAEKNSRAKRLEQQRLQAAKPKPQIRKPTAEDVAAKIAEEQFRIEQFLSIRENLTDDIEDRRDQITYLDQQIAKLSKQLKQLSDQVENAMDPDATASIETAAIAELQAKIAAEKEAIEELRKQTKDDTPRIVIVPHKGPNGTDRRAIYLECTSEGITIWPEGSKITMAELEAARSSNPLDAALRVVRLHALNHYRDATPPYPLLVVRPDGIEAYGAARRAMRDWDDQFGYELVPQDIELAFAKPDFGLKQKVDLAIRSAASRQSPQTAIADSRRFGGAGGRLPTLSAASLDRAGRASGYGSLKDYSQYSHQPSQFPSNATPPPRAPGSGGYRGSNYGALDRNRIGMNPSVVEAMREAELRDQAVRQQGGGSGFGGSGASGEFGQGSPQPGGSKRWTQQLNPYTSVPGGSTAGRRGSGKGQASNEPQPLRDPVPGGESSQAGGQQSQTAQQGGSQGQQGGSQRQQGAAQTGSTAANQLGVGSGSSMTPTAIMQSQIARSQMSRSAASNQSMSASQMGMPQPVTPPMVRRQGTDWALPPHVAGMRGNAIVRTMRLQCYGDRFVLQSSASGGRQQTFTFQGSDINEASLHLATSLRDRIDRWGAALPGGRWQPRLEVEVMPGGESSFRQLERLMTGSGIEISGRGAR